MRSTGIHTALRPHSASSSRVLRLRYPRPAPGNARRFDPRNAHRRASSQSSLLNTVDERRQERTATGSNAPVAVAVAVAVDRMRRIGRESDPLNTTDEVVGQMGVRIHMEELVPMNRGRNFILLFIRSCFDVQLR